MASRITDGTFIILAKIYRFDDISENLDIFYPAKFRRPGWLLTGPGGKKLKGAGIATCRGERGTLGCRVQEAAPPRGPTHQGPVRVGKPTGMGPAPKKLETLHVRR